MLIKTVQINYSHRLNEAQVQTGVKAYDRPPIDDTKLQNLNSQFHG